MYKESSLRSILIVKTSALGDIIQAFNILDYLKQKFPDTAIDWAVEEAFAPLVAAHPHIRSAIPLDMKGMKKGWKSYLSWKSLSKAVGRLRRERYDLLFDLQGNCKSGAVTFLARSKVKVGFGLRTVREKPNILSTQIRFDIPRQLNIRQQYMQLVQRFFKDDEATDSQGVRLKIPELELEKVQTILKHPSLQTPLKIMVCPGSKWINKQLPVKTLINFLLQIEEKLSASFLLVWGAESERAYCEEIHKALPQKSAIIEKLSINTWQNLMNEVDLVIAVDSSALHLCGTTQTPSFSLFGPSSPRIYKPIGPRHFSLQGKCPYGRSFEKTCPILRTCPTGACIRDLSVEEIADPFFNWWKKEKPGKPF